MNSPDLASRSRSASSPRPLAARISRKRSSGVRTVYFLATALAFISGPLLRRKDRTTATRVLICQALDDLAHLFGLLLQRSHRETVRGGLCRGEGIRPRLMLRF